MMLLRNLDGWLKKLAMVKAMICVDTHEEKN